MSKIVVIGAGANGLAAALMLAADDHEVIVLERDPARAPAGADDAWSDWERRGITQFRMVHLFASRWRQVMEAELPDVLKALEAAGGYRFNPILGAPAEISGGERPDDDRFDVLTGRRPVVESCLSAVADATPGVTIRRGVAVAGLRTGESATGDVPHVVGVRTEDGEDIDADLVVDAGGRRSPLPRWLEEIGARRLVEEIEDCGFVYYGRHFRSGDGSVPPSLGGPLQHYESVSTLTLPADNGTWGVAFITSAKDAALRRLSDVETWTRVVLSYPLIAHWLDGEPLDDAPAVMAKIEDRWRRFVVDDAPVATGVAAVGDSWACTNPSLGRGVSIGAIHVQALRDEVRSTGLDDPDAFVRAWDATTMKAVEPWYRATLSFDRHRLAEIDAQIAGGRYRPDDESWSRTKKMEKAFLLDPDVLRAFARIATVQETPDEVFAQPGILERVEEKGAGWEDEVPLGPSRPELEKIVGG